MRTWLTVCGMQVYNRLGLEKIVHAGRVRVRVVLVLRALVDELELELARL